MGTMTTGTAALSPEMQTYYDRRLLDNAKPVLVHGNYGQKRNIPKNNGKTVQFRKFTPLAAATTPLTEGVTPSGNSLEVTEITATVDQYGDFIEISDVLDFTAIDPILDETSELLGNQAGETLDVITRDILHAGTNVQYAGGVAGRVNVAAANKLTVDELRKAVRTLKKNKAKPAVRRNGKGYYVCIVGPDTTYDIQDDSKWIDIQKYQDQKGLLDGEIGMAYGVIFVETTEAKVFAGAGAAAIDVHSTLLLGKDAYGVIDIEGKGAIKNIIKAFGSAGTADPLDQRSTSGWKVSAYTSKILQQLWMLRIEHAVSA